MMRRAGRVFISNRLIQDSSTKELAEMLKDLVIVRAEQIFIKDGIEYEALCEKFDEVNSYDVLPEYQIIYNSENKEVTFRRIG